MLKDSEAKLTQELTECWKKLKTAEHVMFTCESVTGAVSAYTAGTP